MYVGACARSALPVPHGRGCLTVKIMRIFVVMTLLPVTMAAPASAAADQEVSFEGTVLGEHGPPDSQRRISWVGRIAPSSEGEGLCPISEVEYHPDSALFGPVTTSEGNITFVAANGDELWLSTRCLSDGWNNGPSRRGFLFTGEWTAVGGTGRFAHGRGSGDLHGTGNLYEIVDPDGRPGQWRTHFEGDIAYKRK